MTVPNMLNAYFTFLHFRGDFILLFILVGTACLLLKRWLPAPKTQRCMSCRYFIAALVLTLAGGVIAEWAAHDRVTRLQKLFAGFGPTYAYELMSEGHAQITFTTPNDDPRYLELIEFEKRWLSVNPMIADIYTFRQGPDGKIRLLVDSETDYDRNGKIDAQREARTPIGEIYEEATPKFYAALAGESVFESEIMSDRWGIWVSSFTPIYDQTGRIDAALGIDYPADSWLYAIGGIRAFVLGITLVIVAITLTSGAFITLLRLEIEERKDTQKQLEQAHEVALQASATKSEFLALMSHEVRNPLTAILGYANILSDTPLDSRQHRYVETINRAGANLLSQLNGILDYTKAESGKLTLERIAWVPAMVVHEVIELMAARAAEKNLHLHFDNRLSGALTLVGDPTRIRQILINLLSNAIKFTPSGQVTVKAVWTSNPIQLGRGTLLLEVTDTGPGIPADKVPLLFKAFSQADASTTRKHGGTGLGLSICQRLADAMGGAMSLRSTPGVGSTFSFSLNTEGTESQGPSFQTGAAAAPAIAVWNRALVVDDTKLNRELLKVMLRRFGLESDLAAGAMEAIELAGKNQYAIIFSDLEMPEFDGFYAAKEIRRQEPPGRYTPIVAISALTVHGTREKCLAAGMDEYLTKPVYLPALRSTLEVVLPHLLTAGQPGTQPTAAST